MTRALASHSRSCWFWQTNLSRNNDSLAVLDGDDETNGMCPIIGSGRDVHTVRAFNSNTPKHSTNVVQSPLLPLSLFFSRTSVCLFIHPCAHLFICSHI
jgi:hypothetical protein